VRKSSTTFVPVRGFGAASLFPIPARSYLHTRVNRLTSGATLSQSEEGLAAPASNTTVGPPPPEHRK
jgi:hypothetical protein